MYLTGFTDLAVLEEVPIHNGGREDALFLEDESRMVWSTFTASLCPTLRRLSTHVLNGETATWLRAELEHGFLTQLRIETSKKE
jgi:hypothetical protein